MLTFLCVMCNVDRADSESNDVVPWRVCHSQLGSRCSRQHVRVWTEKFPGIVLLDDVT